MRAFVVRWIGPALVAVLVMLGYQLLIAPVLNDARSDWNFLRQARMEAIRQSLQRQQPQK